MRHLIPPAFIDSFLDRNPALEEYLHYMNWMAPHRWAYLDRRFPTAFLRSLKTNLPEDVWYDWPSLRAEISSAAEKIFFDNRSSILDPAAQGHILMTSYILAAYRVLMAYSLSRDEILNVLTRSFSSYGAFWMKWGMRLGLKFSRNPMAMISTFAERRGISAYGKSFEIQSEGDQRQFYSSNVTKCGYHEFFKKNGVPELTPVMCSWDLIWAAQIEPRKHGITFDRPSTIAAGGDMCRFRFRRSQSD